MKRDRRHHFSKTENFFLNLLASNKLLPIHNYYQSTECLLKQSAADITPLFVQDNDHIKNSNVDKNFVHLGLDPMSKSFGFYCASLHCTVDNLRRDQSALVRLRFRLWSKSFIKVSIFYQFINKHINFNIFIFLFFITKIFFN